MPAHSSYMVVTAARITDASAFGRLLLAYSPDPNTVITVDGSSAPEAITGATASVGTPTAVETARGITIALTG